MMRQLKATCRELGRLIEANEQTLDDSDDPQSSQRQRDVEILSSIPGVGRIVLATLLAEASEILKQRNYNALRAFCGSAPVTKRSGKICVVVPVTNAVVRSIIDSRPPSTTGLESHCSTTRSVEPNTTPCARGHRHARALRGVADRLLKVTCAMLENQQLFDHDYPKHELAA